jgi:hypothetical protein
MKLKYLTDTSKAAIKKGITDLRGIVTNANERAQTLAVAVIQHDAEHGDCTLAVDLVNSLPNAEQKRWMVQFFKHFGAIVIDTEKGRATNAKHRDPRSKGYTAPSVDGAKANMWFEPENGGWFAGPPRDYYVPGTIGDVGENVIRFGDRLAKQLDGTKDRGDGTQVPFFDLNDEQRAVANQVVVGLKRLGALMAATQNEAELKIELAKQRALIADATDVLSAIASNEQDTETEIPTAEAVAG